MGANAQTTVPTFTASQVLTADQMNQSARTGIPVFSSTVTRDAGFGGTGEKTLAEGQMCYVEGTGLQSYNGSSWVTWGAAPSQGGLVRIVGETAFTSVASVTIDNIFTSTYRNYLIKARFTFSNTATVITTRFRASGSSNSTANYGDQSNYITTTLTATRTNPATGTSMAVLPNLGAAGLAIDFTFYNPQIATSTQMSYNGTLLDTGNITVFGAGGFGLTNQFDGFEIISSLGNITGEYTVYGYAKS